MTKATRPEPFFIADDRALDLLNSVAVPWGTEIEWLGNGADLLDWLEQVDMVPKEVLARFRREAVPEELDIVASQARELRDWFRTFVGNHAGQPLPSGVLAELAPINAVLDRDDQFQQIGARAIETPVAGQEVPEGRSSTKLQWRRHRRWNGPEDLLQPLAEAVGDCVCQADFERVRNCEGPTCTLWFLDVSKNHTRRWCTMAVCGNRAKAAAHRAKLRAARS